MAASTAPPMAVAKEAAAPPIAGNALAIKSTHAEVTATLLTFAAVTYSECL